MSLETIIRNLHTKNDKTNNEKDEEIEEKEEVDEMEEEEKDDDREDEEVEEDEEDYEDNENESERKEQAALFLQRNIKKSILRGFRPKGRFFVLKTEKNISVEMVLNNNKY